MFLGSGSILSTAEANVERLQNRYPKDETFIGYQVAVLSINPTGRRLFTCQKGGKSHTGFNTITGNMILVNHLLKAYNVTKNFKNYLEMPLACLLLLST